MLPTLWTVVSGPPISDQSPVGAYLLNFWKIWTSIGATQSVTDLLRSGYQITFLYPPTISMRPIHFPLYANNLDNYLVLEQSIQDMSRKKAIEPTDPRSLGFYSRLFVVTKKSGKWRPVIDLSPLNKSIKKTKFKMETIKIVLSSIQANQWFMSIDLTNAYFHIPIHPSRDISFDLSSRGRFSVPSIVLRDFHRLLRFHGGDENDRSVRSSKIHSS